MTPRSITSSLFPKLEEREQIAARQLAMRQPIGNNNTNSSMDVHMTDAEDEPVVSVNGFRLRKGARLDDGDITVRYQLNMIPGTETNQDTMKPDQIIGESRSSGIRGETNLQTDPVSQFTHMSMVTQANDVVMTDAQLFMDQSTISEMLNAILKI